MNLLLWSVLAGPLVAPPEEAMPRVVAAEDGALVRDLVQRGVVRPETQWSMRRHRASHGGSLVVLRERWAGIPIAGSYLALRVGPDGRLRQTLGHVSDPAGALPEAGTEAGPEVGRGILWWPTKDGLVLARQQDEVLHWEAGRPVQHRTWVAIETGRVLARESLIDDVPVSLVSWEENPLTTPEPYALEVEVIDAMPLVLEDSVVRVLQCNWSTDLEECDPVAFPTADEPDGFPADPPALADADAHADVDDPWAGVSVMHQWARFHEDLQTWGWDSFVWDEIDCSSQEVPVEECRLRIHTNVVQQDERGVFPYSGASYSRANGIFMGQGENADTSFDGDIVVHEIGHHVVWGMGVPEPVDIEDDGARRRTDSGAINEGSADVFADLMGETDRIYDYFSAVEPGVYVDHRIRDVSIPFRCPENVVGEVHMEGRIWASAIHDARLRIEEEGFGDRDAFATMWLDALRAVRQIPLEQKEQFADAVAILVNETELALGPEAAAIVQEIVDERGLSSCDHTLDLKDEPNFALDPDPNEPLDARFMVFSRYATDIDPEIVEENPPAPAVFHRITLTDDEGGLRLRYRPAMWRPDHPVDDIDLRMVALLRLGDEGVHFWRDPDTDLIENDAELRFESVKDPEGDGLDEIVIEGLEPGATYSIALAPITALDDDSWLIEHMRWDPLAAPDEGDETGGSDGESGESETGTDTTMGAGDGEGGCACRTDPSRGGTGWMLLLLGAVPFLWRRASHNTNWLRWPRVSRTSRAADWTEGGAT